MEHRASIFRMELNTYEPRMGRQFYYFHKIFVFVYTGEFNAISLIQTKILVIELISVTMAFLDFISSIDIIYSGSFHQRALVVAETHGSAHTRNFLLVFHQVDDRIIAARLNFRGICIF